MPAWRYPEHLTLVSGGVGGGGGQVQQRCERFYVFPSISDVVYASSDDFSYNIVFLCPKEC